MIENFSWKTNNKGKAWRNYVRSIPKENIEEILGSIPSAWNVPPKGHHFFAKWLVEKVNPKVTVELGVDYGYSLFIWSIYNNGKVYGIDSFSVEHHQSRVDDDYQIVMDIKEKLNLDNLEVMVGYFDDIASTWKKKIDILHIDGLHDYNSCKNDYETWKKFMKKTGVILFHDTISYRNDVGRLFSEIDLPKFNFTNSHGLGVVSSNKKLIEEIQTTFGNQ
jgi:hypothetical protein